MLKKWEKINGESRPGTGSVRKYNTLIKVLSFHNIWFKSVKNILTYPAGRQRHKHTDTQTDRSYHIYLCIFFGEGIIFHMLALFKLHNLALSLACSVNADVMVK